MTYQNAAAIAEQIGEYSPLVGDRAEDIDYKLDSIVEKIKGKKLKLAGIDQWFYISNCTLIRTSSGITMTNETTDKCPKCNSKWTGHGDPSMYQCLSFMGRNGELMQSNQCKLIEQARAEMARERDADILKIAKATKEAVQTILETPKDRDWMLKTLIEHIDSTIIQYENVLSHGPTQEGKV